MVSRCVLKSVVCHEIKSFKYRPSNNHKMRSEKQNQCNSWLVCNGISSTNWDKDQEPSVALEKSVSVQPEELPHSSWTTEMYFQVPNKIHRNAAHFCNTPTCVNYLNPKKKTYDYLGIIGSCCKMLFGVPLDN
ncbi:hypothetical protein RB195_018885 [Necator americanus]|uniref:Uncharacterized protein n=1 Tax=Necator americanus TaxID=51031 RepID=A0ABR1CFA6_NECAM